MDILKEWMAAAVAAVGFIVWLVRMEGRMNQNTREILRIEKQMDQDRETAREARSETNDMLREVRSDITRLLERGQ